MPFQQNTFTQIVILSEHKLMKLEATALREEPPRTVVPGPVFTHPSLRVPTTSMQPFVYRLPPCVSRASKGHL